MVNKFLSLSLPRRNNLRQDAVSPVTAALETSSVRRGSGGGVATSIIGHRRRAASRPLDEARRPFNLDHSRTPSASSVSRATCVTVRRRDSVSPTTMISSSAQLRKVPALIVVQLILWTNLWLFTLFISLYYCTVYSAIQPTLNEAASVLNEVSRQH